MLENIIKKIIPEPEILTTSHGVPVQDDQNSFTAGRDGGILLQDFHLIDKIAHFNRERVPERVVHAKGAGAHGYFEVTKDISHLTKAKFLSHVGKRTPLFTRFSVVGGEKGAPDCVRDPRGFAIKFYTEEGNFDFVANNTPVFFIRDTIKFPDFIHTQKRNPQTNLKDKNMFWDFLALTPESTHQVTILFTNRGTPKGFRFMNGYYGHTLKLVNDKGECHFVKFHFKSEQGIKNFKDEEAVKMAGENPDYGTEDLFEAIERGEYPKWKLMMQVMTLEEAKTYRFNPFDITKVWPHPDFPLQEVGQMTLSRNPENFFAETEQVAFNPANMPPGIEPSPDRMLQGRLFAYADAHRYRVGANYTQLPINCPFKSNLNTYHRDGSMAFDNPGPKRNYYPNSFEGPKPLITQLDQDEETKDITTNSLGSGMIKYPENGNYHRNNNDDQQNIHARYSQPLVDDDFIQAGNLYRKLEKEEQDDLIKNIVGHLSGANKEIQNKMCEHFSKADPEYGNRVRKGLAWKI
ncbi:catalase [Neoconidiobolus thromboides FSU 785]|nr:catalase [Neoconidiobolus thromboides FSU 785]